MPKRTQEQIDADALAEKAVAALRSAYNRSSDERGATLLNFAIVAESIIVGEDGEISDEFTDIFTNHDCRLTTAKGLLVIGVEEVVKDTDDE